MNQEIFHKFGFTFKAPSKRKNKKYDVYYDDIYLTSFGQLPYEHYEDKIGYYRDLNHYDKKRKDNYRTRHRHDNISDLSSAGFWSWHFLW